MSEGAATSATSLEGERVGISRVPARPAEGHREASAEKPLQEIRGGPGRLTTDTLREAWEFREVLWAFAVRAVKVKYKQAVIGVGWAVIQPVVAAVLFALTIGKLTEIPSEGVPYFLFVLAGMTAWSFFAGTLTTSMNSLVAEQPLLRKVYFPRDLVPLSAVVAGVVDLAPALATLVVGSLLYGILPAASWIALPIPVFLLVILAAALGLGLSAINVYYRDVRYALPFLVQLGLFASPIVYSLNSMGEPSRTLYGILNPVAAAIDGFRRIVIHGEWPDLLMTAGAFGWSLLLLLMGYALFKRLERGFADRV